MILYIVGGLLLLTFAPWAFLIPFVFVQKFIEEWMILWRRKPEHARKKTD